MASPLGQGGTSGGLGPPLPTPALRVTPPGEGIFRGARATTILGTQRNDAATMVGGAVLRHAGLSCYETGSCESVLSSRLKGGTL